MIWRNRWKALAPSTLAASKYSFGIETMPAMKIRVASPTPFQTSTIATDSSAVFGSTSQAGPWMPMVARTWLTSPLVGFSSTWKVIPTPMVLTRTGKKLTERRKPRPISWEVRSRASSRPTMTFTPEVTVA